MNDEASRTRRTRPQRFRNEPGVDDMQIAGSRRCPRLADVSSYRAPLRLSRRAPCRHSRNNQIGRSAREKKAETVARPTIRLELISGTGRSLEDREDASPTRPRCKWHQRVQRSLDKRHDARQHPRRGRSDVQADRLEVDDVGSTDPIHVRPGESTERQVVGRSPARRT